MKHIEYEHQLNCNNVAGEAGTAQGNMTEEKQYHESQQREMRNEKKN